jgi:hypothetical protein
MLFVNIPGHFRQREVKCATLFQPFGLDPDLPAMHFDTPLDGGKSDEKQQDKRPWDHNLSAPEPDGLQYQKIW